MRNKRRTMRVRTVVAALGVATAMAALSGLASGKPTIRQSPAHSSAQRFTGFDGLGVSFRYPAAWRSETDGQDMSSFSTLIVYLSNMRLYPPCLRWQIKKVIYQSCQSPIRQLARNSILAEWSSWAFPGWKLSRVRGKPLRVGGRPAKLLETKGPTPCLDANTSIDVVIDRPGGAGYYDFNACIKGPDTRRFERQVTALLKTVRFGR
jgi:hypothetical protein